MKLNLTMARAIAADWHGGQASSLYSFASTGKVYFPQRDYVTEVLLCKAEGEEKVKLDSLLNYLRKNRWLLKP